MRIRLFFASTFTETPGAVTVGWGESRNVSIACPPTATAGRQPASDWICIFPSAVSVQRPMRSM